MGRALILSIITLLVVGVLPASAAPVAARPSPQGLGPAPQHDENLAGAGVVAAMAQDRKHPNLASTLVGVGKQDRAAGRAAALGEAQAAGLSVKDDRVRVE